MCENKLLINISLEKDMEVVSQKESSLLFPGVLLFLIGLFFIYSCVFKWKWFMHQNRNTFVVKGLPEIEARLFYLGFGLIMTIFGSVLIYKSTIISL